jgi:hypothetical protein
MLVRQPPQEPHQVQPPSGRSEMSRVQDFDLFRHGSWANRRPTDRGPDWTATSSKWGRHLGRSGYPIGAAVGRSPVGPRTVPNKSKYKASQGKRGRPTGEGTEDLSPSPASQLTSLSVASDSPTQMVNMEQEFSHVKKEPFDSEEALWTYSNTVLAHDEPLPELGPAG